MRTITRRGLPTPEEREALRLLRERNGFVLTVTSGEKSIIDDIFARTNWYAERLGGYETTDEEVARDVLPILLEWFPRVADRPNFRGAIYQRFSTPHAAPFADVLMDWYLSEGNSMNQGMLAQVLAKAARSEHAVRLWQVCKARPELDCRIYLMVALSQVPVVAADVKDEMVKILYGDPTPGIGYLQEFAKVRDPRVYRWFQSKLRDPNVRLRSIARRCMRPGSKLPSGLTYARELPDRRLEARSWESNLGDFGKDLRNAAREFNLKVPARILQGQFLETAHLDNWMVTTVAVEGEPKRVALWFRLEDIGTVEIVIGGPVRAIAEVKN
jgi:hypothetical protein